jgi:alkanesulfonate monooxygenase SsuD/methylene tetrahydromethanopterin reductase-like flavin-dependent oxidoreductase (luciferase family)
MRVGWVLPYGDARTAPDERWSLFEDDPGRRMRAEQMDEALDLIQALWSGEPVT